MVCRVYDIKTVLHVVCTVAELTFSFETKGRLENAVSCQLPAGDTALSLQTIPVMTVLPTGSWILTRFCVTGQSGHQKWWSKVLWTQLTVPSKLNLRLKDLSWLREMGYQDHRRLVQPGCWESRVWRSVSRRNSEWLVVRFVAKHTWKNIQQIKLTKF